MTQLAGSPSPSTVTILITGANSGLGFGICCRIIDDFLLTRPPWERLHLLFSTRDRTKGNETVARLSDHLRKSLIRPALLARKDGRAEQSRITLENVLVDLTKLLTVRALADELLARNLRLHAVIWNAGIAGWTGLDWPKTIWHVLTDMLQAVTYPTYAICDVGRTAGTQLESTKNGRTEPKLGQVFLSNVFGHYMLTHWLSPLLDSSSRIVWISSITALPATFTVADLQGLTSDVAYEGSKRLTDMLVLTSELPSVRPYISTFLPDNAHRPRMFVTHPGVVGTSIASLNWLLSLAMTIINYVARWLGSPWHLVGVYKGAISATFCALAPAEQLEDLERRDGKGKWGSVINVLGQERVGRTEVEGWGFSGILDAVPPGSVDSKMSQYRHRNATTSESRLVFEENGREVWKQMEGMRVEWEQLLEDNSP